MTIFIPDKIKVGYQNRQGTYTGRLAYVIYYDGYGKLRKETSWQSWRHKDIEPNDFDNVPTEGFVLNKKAGGYASHWHTRATYCRVYDPRNFEFEVTIENLLYILENTDCIKGKGLAGTFVYGWDGKDLLLMPTCAPDYAEIKSVSETVNAGTWLQGKDLNPGGTYLTNKNEYWVYLGRFEYWHVKSWWKKDRTVNKGRHYFFSASAEQLQLEAVKSLTRRVISEVDSSPVLNYATLMDELEHRREYSPVERRELVPLSRSEFESRDWYRHSDLAVDNEDSGLYVFHRQGSETADVNSDNWRARSSRVTLDKLFTQHNLYKIVYYLKNGKQLKE